MLDGNENTSQNSDIMFSNVTLTKLDNGRTPGSPTGKSTSTNKPMVVYATFITCNTMAELTLIAKERNYPICGA